MTRIRKHRGRQGGGCIIIQSARTSILLSFLLITLLPTITTSISFPELVEPYISRIYDPNNPSESCFTKLYESDIDGNGIVTNDEYTTFVSELSEGTFNETNYIDLPFVLKVNFVYLSCLCTIMEGSNSDCCTGADGGIFVAGSNPNETPSELEEAYLITVCSETQGAIDYAVDELTSSPTVVTTSSPTVGVTQAPSAQPTKIVSVYWCSILLCINPCSHYFIIILPSYRPQIHQVYLQQRKNQPKLLPQNPHHWHLR